MRPEQLSLLDAVARTYASADGPIDNSLLYKSVASRVGIEEAAFHHKVPIGAGGALRSPLARAARWAQQTLKVRGLLERVERGVWSLTGAGRRELHAINKHYSLVAFSTDLGVGVWGRCEDVFQGLEAPIDLVVTSPPYPLQAKPRAYGNPPAEAYVDFLCAALEPVVARLAPGAHIALNLSNDIFERGSPARSLYKERLVLALHDRLGLYKMDELVWHVRNKPPGPTQWASIKRVQLSVAWEPVIVLALDPERSKADNRRVLEPHSERHLKLQAAGGENRFGDHGDGAYRHRPGDFGKPTPGRIPRNVLDIPTTCASQRLYKRHARQLGLPAHAAAFPLRLSSFLIEFLSAPGDLVVDPFGGSGTVGVSAESLGRRWLLVEMMAEYVRGAAERFRERPGFWVSEELDFLVNR